MGGKDLSVEKDTGKQVRMEKPKHKSTEMRFDLFDDYFNPPMAKTAAGDFY